MDNKYYVVYFIIKRYVRHPKKTLSIWGGIFMSDNFFNYDGLLRYNDYE